MVLFSIRSQGNRAYLLQMPSGKVSVYCHMTSHGLGACGGGGWTLVMKTDGTKVIYYRTSNRKSFYKFVTYENDQLNICLFNLGYISFGKKAILDKDFQLALDHLGITDSFSGNFPSFLRLLINWWEMKRSRKAKRVHLQRFEKREEIFTPGKIRRYRGLRFPKLAKHQLK